MNEPTPQGTALDKAFPEIGSSLDPAQVPWSDSVVWSERSVDGRRVYEWITKDHVAKVGWTNGLVSVEVHNSSFLAKDIRYFIIQAPFVAVGQNMPV